MPPSTGTYRFGPFHLDPARRHLARGDERVVLPDRPFDVLVVLVARAGHIVSNDDITRVVWPDFDVSDNAISKAVSILKQQLGNQASGEPYIERHVRKGYRFVAPVEFEPAVTPASAASPHPPVGNGRNPFAALEPHAAFMDGRAALETLHLDDIARAGEAFATAIRLNPTFAPAHIGMANVCLLRYESTRADVEPNRAALAEADRHATEACRLNPRSGHAWSAFSLVRHGHGDSRKAIAAAREAIALEREEWRHHVRLAHVSWGAERLQAATEVLSLCPALPFGHWFAATLFIARSALDKALAHLAAGCAAQDAQQKAGSPLRMIGMHWLHAVVLSALGHSDAALAELKLEGELEPSEHVYARECDANRWYLIGALALRDGHHELAQAAFREATARVAGHPLAHVGLAAALSPLPSALTASGTAGQSLGLGPSSLVRPSALGALGPLSSAQNGDAVGPAIVCAAALALQAKHDDGARVCGGALTSAPPGSAGWLLPVEPLIHPSAHQKEWSQTLSVLRSRAL